MAEPVTLDELKNWLRIDVDDDDILIEALGIASREFIETATGLTLAGPDIPARAAVAIKALAAHWYEHRDIELAPPAHVGRLINQLRDWREPAGADE